MLRNREKTDFSTSQPLKSSASFSHQCSKVLQKPYFCTENKNPTVRNHPVVKQNYGQGASINFRHTEIPFPFPFCFIDDGVSDCYK